VEGVVFGKITGKEMVRFVNNEGGALAPVNATDVVLEQQRITELKARSKEGGVRQNDIREALTQNLNENCSVFRDEKRLGTAMAAVRKARNDYAKLCIDDKDDAFNTDLITALELRSLIDCAEAMVASAAARLESRGAHTREEYPTRDDAHWMKHSLACWDTGTNAVKLDYDPVRQTGNPRYAPQERKY
jgi:succinate dehydrogenase / fumarate reductase flavoprotein subunit